MRDPNSPSLSLFDQLGAGMDIMGQVPVPKVHRYSEDADEGEIAPSEVPAGTMEEEAPMETLRYYIPKNADNVLQPNTIGFTLTGLSPNKFFQHGVCSNPASRTLEEHFRRYFIFPEK